MEETKINSKKSSNKKLKNKNSFKIRKKNSFLEDNKENISKIWKKKSSIKNISPNNKKSFYKKKSRKSLFLSLNDFNNIEEEIKNIIIEMKKACLWELKLQNYNINILTDYTEKEDNKKKMSSHKNLILQNNIINDNDKDNQIKNFIKLKKSRTLSEKNIIKKNKDIDSKNNNNIKKNKINEFKSDFERTKTFNKKKIVSPNEKFRFLSRECLIIDSFDEHESEEEPEYDGYYINPETIYIYIYDIIIAFCVFYSLIYIPCEFINSICLCNTFNNFYMISFDIFLDILFLFDILINFFLEYYTKDEEILIKNTKKIIKNYIFGWFFLDFIAGCPINIFSFYFCKTHIIQICHIYEKSNSINFLILLKCLKALKIFKILSRKKNQFMTDIFEKCSENIIFENIFDILCKILFVIFVLHIVSCFHIFIGRHTFPGWIHNNEYQNNSLLNLYMISIYYITTTLTTVGYGDIQSGSMIEIAFRLILLAVGIIGYSWLISSISNGINKESFASLNYSNDMNILEDIRRANKKLSYSLYLNIMNHLKQKHYYQKKYDKNLLINNLPYTLKNNLIFSMYKTAIEKFDYFKGVSNSNFLVEILSHLSPITANKDDILLKENDLVEEMFFVKEGKLAIEIPININNPEKSINKYLSGKFLNYAFDFDYNLSYTQIKKNNKFTTGINNISVSNKNLLNSFTLKKADKISPKIIYLKIHDIHINEDFGDMYMYFGKRTPFALRVKTKKVKLYVIKKDDFSKIYGQYQNIFRLIHKKKKHNLKIIKNILIKIIYKFCDTKGIKIDEQFKTTIQKAINEIHKEYIPIDILKKAKLDESVAMDEIEEEINETIRDFDIELSHFQSSLNLKEKFRNFIKMKSFSNIKNSKPSFLKDYNYSSLYESKYYSSIKKHDSHSHLKHKTKKIKKNIRKIKSSIKKNISMKCNSKNINFNSTESDDSMKTEEIKELGNDSYTKGPNTIKVLPESLINSLNRKIKSQQFPIKKKINYKEDQLFFSKKDIKKEIKKNEKNNNIFNSSIYDIIKKERNINSFNFKKIKKNNKTNYRYKKNSFSNFHRNNILNEHISLPFTSPQILSPKIKNNKYENFIFNNQKNREELIFNKNYLNKELKTDKINKEFINKNISFNIENLSSTSVESFEIKRSYKNLNQVTKGEFIKDIKFQKDALKFIYNYKKEERKINNKLKRNSKSTLDLKIIKNKDKNQKNNFNEFKKSIKSVGEIMTKFFLKKNDKNKKNNINSIKIDDKSFSSKKLRNKSTKKELSIISNLDNNQIFNSNNINYYDDTLGKFNNTYDNYKIGKLNRIDIDLKKNK